MNVALLGPGSIARFHAAAWNALRDTGEESDLRLHTVAGPHPEEAADFAREFGFERHTTDSNAVFEDPEVDAVVVCSPTDLHAVQAERALSVGKHVLCEIPLATSLAGADHLARLADEVDRRLMVCHTERYYPGLVEARRMVAAGDLHPHALIGRYMFQRRENRDWTGRQREWTDNLLWHHGCHAVDTALWLLGATEVEVASQIALPGGNLGIVMDLTVAMRTPEDQIATIIMSYNTHIFVHDYLVIGEETTLLYETPTPFAAGRLRTDERTLVESDGRPVLEGPLRPQDAEFFAAVREGREPAISARAVRPAMAALQAAQDALDAQLRVSGPGACHPLLPEGPLALQD